MGFYIVENGKTGVFKKQKLGTAGTLIYLKYNSKVRLMYSWGLLLFTKQKLVTAGTLIYLKR